MTFGFDTAVATVTDALERVQTTGQSHGRVMIVETMGRYAGWIALESGLAFAELYRRYRDKPALRSEEHTSELQSH